MLSKKEMISIYQIVLAVLCGGAFFVYTWTFRYPYDVFIYFAQCSVLATGIICLIYAFGTWFYNSNFKETRLHTRIVTLIVLLILTLTNIASGVLLYLNYFDEEIDGFEKDIWDETDLLFITIAVILSLVVGVLMIPMDMFLIFRIIKKAKKNE